MESTGEPALIAVPLAAPARFDNFPQGRANFGEAFTATVASATWTAEAGWSSLEVGPRRPILIDPAMAALHYGQSVFEGLKAYRSPTGGLWLFRPEAHAARLRASARRFVMPEPPVSLFMSAVGAVASRDLDWVTPDDEAALYLRPILLASEPTLALRPARSYLFMVMAFVTGGFFSDTPDPISVWVESEYVRAAPGGVGSAKCAGNYAPTYITQAGAAQAGYQQVVWLDAIHQERVEEMGGMNLFFVRDHGAGTMVTTPPLSDTILPGVTRDSVLTLAAECGYMVREEPLTVGRWQQESLDGRLTETFACGTAAGVTPIGRVGSSAGEWAVGTATPGPVTLRLHALLRAAQRDSTSARGWMVPVNRTSQFGDQPVPTSAPSGASSASAE